MRLYIENASAMDKVVNNFDAKEDLVELLESVQESDKTISPIEVAALHLTMRQIDTEYEIPAVESYTNNPNFYTTLAIESLKDNIKGKWEAFLKAVKAIFKRIKDYVSGLYQKFRRRFKRKAGDKNGYFEREGENGQEESTEQEDVHVEKDSAKPITSDYTIDRFYIDMGDRADASSLLERLQFMSKLIHIVDVTCSRYGGINGELLKTLSSNDLPDTLQKQIQSIAQSNVDQLLEFGFKLKDGKSVILEISETLSIEMPLEDINSFPAYNIKEGNEVTITLPNDRNNYADKLQKASNDLIDKSLKFFKDSSKLAESEMSLEKVTNPNSREIVMKMASLYTARMKLTTQTCKLLNAITEIADGIEADIRGQAADLATESADGNKLSAWKRFVEMLKKIYAKIKSTLKATWDKIKGGGKEDNGKNKFEYEEKKDEETGEVHKQPVGVTVRNCNLGFGTDTNLETMKQRINLIPTILEWDKELSSIWDSASVATAALNLDDQEWQDFVQERKQETFNFVQSLPNTKNENGKVIAHICDSYYIQMEKDDTYPTIIMDQQATTFIVLDESKKEVILENGKMIDELTRKLKGVVVTAETDWSGIKSEEAINRVMTLNSIYGNRAMVSYRLVDSVTQTLNDSRSICRTAIWDTK